MTTIDPVQPLRVTFIGSYPPRKCGIATFTTDLLNGIQDFYLNGTNSGKQEKLQVIAMNDTTTSPGYDYDREVSFEIREHRQEDYRRAAAFINLSSTDVISLQHEFGLFGGENGSYIIRLLQQLKKPLVTTLHTVLEKPTPEQLKTLKEICRLSSAVIVQAEKAVGMMKNIYDVPAEKIVMIHHGTPDVPFLDSFYHKEQFQAEGKKVLFTFGLLSPSKGIEYVIKALPKVVAEFPNLLFIILGATHPAVVEHSGEEYRHSLEKMVKDNNLEKNVVFHNQYVTLKELLQFMEVSDIYISPYINKEQIVSGTLAYALACGKAIISTPYWYAEELLNDGRGHLVSFRDSQSIAEALKALLKDDTRHNQMRKKAYQFGRQMIWQKVAQAYSHTFRQALFNYTDIFVHPSREKDPSKGLDVPKINLSQMRTLTDDTGFYQHAVFTVPNRQHGYCTDDNARALLVAVMNWRIHKDKTILPLLYVYLSFLNHALNTEKGRMRNFMSFNREWLEEAGSEDSHGRTIWVLGYTVAHPPTRAILNIITRLFKQTIDATTSFKASRAWAYSVLGSLYYLEHFGGDTEVRRIVKELSYNLLTLLKANATEDWFWLENSLTYDNARLPHAILAAGHYLHDSEMFDLGLKALEWLIAVQTDSAKGHLVLIGNKGWYQRDGKKARFDQQPLDAAALVTACRHAYMITKKPYWRERMAWAFSWFLGNNDINQPIYNFATGGCYDGLEPGGTNQNQGGESTIAFLLALHKMYLTPSFENGELLIEK